MGWSIGYDHGLKRDVGYGVPCICEYPGCNEEINRGLGYVCGDMHGEDEDSCALYFCEKHGGISRCDRCEDGKDPYEPKPDTQEWVDHKMTHHSWEKWRKGNGHPEPDPVTTHPDVCTFCESKVTLEDGWWICKLCDSCYGREAT